MAFEININGEVIPYNTYGDPMYVNSSDIQEQLNSASGEDLLVNINSPGGDVDEGFMIYTMLRKYASDHKAKVTTYAKGRCHSIATIIFLAGDERIANRFLEPFIHCAWTYAEGDAKEFSRVAVELDKLNDRLANFYASHTDLTAEQAKELMQAETFISPDEAVAIRFATSIEEVLRPVALNSIFNKPKQTQKLNKQKMAKGNKNPESLLVVLKEFFGLSDGKNLVEVNTSTGDVLTFPDLEEGAAPKVGDKATINGEAASGEITSADGTVYVFENGELTEIRETEEDDQDDSFEALKKENAELKAKLEAQNSAILEIKNKQKEEENRWKNLKNLVSKHVSESKDSDEEEDDKTSRTPGVKAKNSKGGFAASAKRLSESKRLTKDK